MRRGKQRTGRRIGKAVDKGRWQDEGRKRVEDGGGGERARRNKGWSEVREVGGREEERESSGREVTEGIWWY